MIFTSLQFLIFLVIVFIVISLIRVHKYQIYILLAASYVFYGAWNPGYVLLIMLTSFIGWSCGILIHKSNHDKNKKIYLIISVVASLGILAYYKYANFIIENISAILHVDIPETNIILPVGISFFTFQSLSYTMDLYRGRIQVCNSLPKFFLFVAFFPQLVAGPIVRAAEFLPQLNHQILIRKHNIIRGAQIFLIGAFQKVVIANNLSTFVDRVFEQPDLYSASTLWLAAISYSIQIFCDFSGYSLMAIGVARLFGFELPENFRMPYISTSISEFWRRWHITLSYWLRDYLYISLGGNRSGYYRTFINLIITMVLGGLWHGASWNFVIWGLMHGIGLVIHKVWDKYSSNILNRNVKESLIYKIIAWFLTYLFVLLLWIPFRSTEFNKTILIYNKLLHFEVGVDWLYTQGIILIAVTFLWHLVYLLKSGFVQKYPYENMTLANMFIIGVIFMSILLFAPLQVSPFIYFQF